MSRNKWNDWLEHEGDEVLTFMYTCEVATARAIQGIWFFLVTTIPDFCRHLLSWLSETFVYLCRVATRAARLAGLVLAWLLIVFGPLVFYPGFITGGWSALALAGSWWGVRHRQVKTVFRPERKKEGFYA